MSPTGATPSMDWLETANRLETVAHQLSSVVHEVNNILQVVSGSAEMLAMTAGAPMSVLRRADVIGAQAQRAAAILADVLTFSRETPEVERVDLREVVGRALSMRRYAMSKVGIEQRVDLCDEEAAVHANPRGLLQIVLNLALRAEGALAGRGDARLSVSVSREPGHVVLVVEENSASDPADAAEELTFDSSPSGVAPGSLGIGLHVAAWLAQQDHGQLSIAPRAGGGSFVTLRLPAA